MVGILNLCDIFILVHNFSKRGVTLLITITLLGKERVRLLFN